MAVRLPVRERRDCGEGVSLAQAWKGQRWLAICVA
jgi:hypothetical protein